MKSNGAFLKGGLLRSRSAGVWAVAMAICWCFAATDPVHAGGDEVEVSVTLQYSVNDLSFDTYGEFDLIRLSGDGAKMTGQPGEPWLPAAIVHVLLPPGTRATGAFATVSAQQTLPQGYDICPAQPAVPFSAAAPLPFTAKSTTAYQSTVASPVLAATLETGGRMRGYSIAAVLVYPVAYIPATGDVILRNQIHLTVTAEEDPAPLSGYSAPESIFEELVASDVANPGDLVEFYPPAPLGGGMVPLSPVDPDDIKYLIVTTSSFVDEFQPLADWKTKKGVPAAIVTTQFIEANYSGASRQQKIKACIRDYALNKGTVWVLLGGDSINGDDANSIVPDYNCYCAVGYYSDTTFPTDLYYADIDDLDWNDDADSLPCEIAGNGDTIDLYPDVFLGRFPARTEQNVVTMVAKTIDYEKSILATNFAESMLLSGTLLWSYIGSVSDAECKSEFMYSSWIDPYWTPVRKRFYDSNTDFTGGASYDLSPTNLNTQLCEGYNYLHMATHGDTALWGMESGGYYTTTHAAGVLNTDKYANILTIACLSNGFDQGEPSLSEAFMRNPDRGTVSFIGGARYGWGIPYDCVHASSFQFDRMFYEFLFTGDSYGHPQRLGAVYTHMKEYHIPVSGSYDDFRWCMFSVNLMGDPEMPLYTANPTAFSPTYPSTINVGTQTFTVHAGVSGADVCLAKGNEVYAYGSTDSSGDFQATINPTTAGSMTVTISAPNRYPHEGAVTVSDSNDECIHAKILGNGGYAHFGPHFAGATLSAEPIPGCVSPDTPQKDIWYKFHPGLYKNVSLYMYADLPGSGFVVYSGSCGSLTLLGCSTGTTEEESFTFISDQQVELDYYIRLYGSYSVPPGGELDVDWTNANNNECVGAKIIGNGSYTYFGGDVSGATLGSEAIPSCHTGSAVADVWYKFHPGVYKEVSVYLGADLPDAGFAVYSGSCGSLFLVDCGTVDKDESYLTFITDQFVDQDYYIRLIVAYTMTGGELHLSWTNANNNECAGARILGNGGYAHFGPHFAGATLSAEPIPGCVSPDTPQKDIWYKFHPGLYKNVTLYMYADLPGSGFVVYSGSCGSLTLLGCSTGTTEEESFTFISDQQVELDYYIRLYGSYSIPPGGELDVDWTNANNNECVGAKILTNGGEAYFGSDMPGATLSPEPIPACYTGATAADVWYRFHPGLYQDVTIYLMADLSDAGFVIYSGSCGALSVVGCGVVDPKEGEATLTFLSDQIVDQDYYVRLLVPNLYTGGILQVSWTNAN